MIAILILGRNLWLFWWECHVFCERFWINGFGVIPTLKRINNSRQESSDAPQNRFKPFLKFLRAFHLTKMAKMSLMDTKKNEPFSVFKTFMWFQTWRPRIRAGSAGQKVIAVRLFELLRSEQCEQFLLTTNKEHCEQLKLSEHRWPNSPNNSFWANSLNAKIFKTYWKQRTERTPV